MSETDKDEPRDPPEPVLLEDGTLLIQNLPNGDRIVASKGWIDMKGETSNAELIAEARREYGNTCHDGLLSRLVAALEAAEQRTVTVVEELDALPTWSVVQDIEHEVYRKAPDGLWYCWGDDPHGETAKGVFWHAAVATVLYAPK